MRTGLDKQVKWRAFLRNGVNLNMQNSQGLTKTRTKTNKHLKQIDSMPEIIFSALTKQVTKICRHQTLKMCKGVCCFQNSFGVLWEQEFEGFLSDIDKW